jgi:hypothetical protein
MDMYDYYPEDLDTCMCELFPHIDLSNDITEYFGYGITEQEYDKVFDVDLKYFEDWNMIITDEKVRGEGFDDLTDFKTVLIITHIYRNRLLFNGQQTLKEMLNFYYWKASYNYPNDNIMPRPESGNLIDYLQTYSLKQLLIIGL